MACNVLGIAIDSYDDSSIVKLNNCQSDLTAVITILQSRYEVNDITLLLKKQETTKRFIYNTIYNYAVNLLEDDSLIIFFFGHGEYNTRSEQSYWLASDSFISEQSSWILVNEILSFFKNADLKHFCLIADNCYSGAIFEDADRGGGIKALEDRKSRYAITSGSIEKVKDGVPGHSSPFNKVLCSLLENNVSDYPVSLLGNHIILSFPENVKQTPRHGVIKGVGDNGGSLVLKFNENNNDLIHYKIIQLPLKVTQSIDFSCDVISFESNRIFDSAFVNVVVQNLAYEILADLRYGLNHEDFKDRTSSYLDYHIGCTVDMVSDKYVSLTVSIEGYLGGPYPFNRIESINIAVDSDRKINIGDLFEISDQKLFFQQVVEKYSELDEQREILLEHVDYFNINEIRFSLHKDVITFYLLNYIPKVNQCYAFLNIPAADFDIDLGNVYETEQK